MEARLSSIEAVSYLLNAAGKRLVTGSHDKYMMLADIQGHVQRTWKASHVHDLAISKDGCLLFCVTSEKKVKSGVEHTAQASAMSSWSLPGY